MNKIQELDQYFKKKDLSKIDKKNIIQIFCQLDDNAPIIETIDTLLKFPQEIIGDYLIQTFAKKKEFEQNTIINTIKKVEPIKVGHLFRAFCSLILLNYDKYAFDLLFEITEKYLIGNDINKKIFQGFDKTVKDCTLQPFIRQFNEDKKRHLNIFVSFLKEYFKYSKNDKIVQQLIEFCDLNNVPTPLEIVNCQNSLEDRKENALANKVITFEEIIKMATASYNELSGLNDKYVKQYELSEDELKKCKNELNAKAIECLDLKDRTYLAQEKNDTLKENLAIAQAELFKLKNEKRTLDKNYSNLQSRLENIISAYEAAGEQEVSALKGKLAARLKVSFDKYTEIKNCRPDMSYYEILILILDEIKKTLNKNGIEI